MPRRMPLRHQTTGCSELHMNRDNATGGRHGVLVKTVIAVSAAVAIFAGVAVGMEHPRPEVMTTTSVTETTDSYDGAQRHAHDSQNKQKGFL